MLWHLPTQSCGALKADKPYNTICKLSTAIPFGSDGVGGVGGLAGAGGLAGVGSLSLLLSAGSLSGSGSDSGSGNNDSGYDTSTEAPTDAPTSEPTSEPTSDCTDYTLSDGSAWHDSAGDEYTCDYYEEQAGQDHCEDYGYEYGGYRADEACCTCGGGSTGTDTPTESPTDALTDAPTQEPTSDCTDYTLSDGSAWRDSAGQDYTCDYYEEQGDDHCKDYGDKYEYGGYTANEACCTCGGGSTGTDANEGYNTGSGDTDTPTEAPTDDNQGTEVDDDSDSSDEELVQELSVINHRKRWSSAPALVEALDENMIVHE